MVTTALSVLHKRDFSMLHTKQNVFGLPVKQVLKGEVQKLARAVDSQDSSLSSSTSVHLGEVNRLASQAARCKSVITALDGLVQASTLLDT